MTGGIQTDGAEAVAVAESQIGDAGGTGFRSFLGLAGTLQAWSDGAANHGWAIVTDGHAGPPS